MGVLGQTQQVPKESPWSWGRGEEEQRDLYSPEKSGIRDAFPNLVIGHGIVKRVYVLR